MEIVGEEILERAESADRFQRLALHRDGRAERIAHRLERLGENHLRREIGVDEERLHPRGETVIRLAAIDAGDEAGLFDSRSVRRRRASDDRARPRCRRR